MDLKKAAVAEARRQGHKFEVKPEETPVALSQCNAHVERAIWEVEAKIRTLKAMAEDIHKVKLNASHPLLCWAAEYAGLLLSLFQSLSSMGGRPIKSARGSFTDENCR